MDGVRPNDEEGLGMLESRLRGFMPNYDRLKAGLQRTLGWTGQKQTNDFVYSMTVG